MKPFADEAHKTKRAKMGCITGSPANFESGADKAARFCRGGYAEGGGVEPQPKDLYSPEDLETISKPMNMGASDAPASTKDQNKGKDD